MDYKWESNISEIAWKTNHALGFEIKFKGNFIIGDEKLLAKPVQLMFNTVQLR